MLYVAALDR